MAKVSIKKTLQMVWNVLGTFWERFGKDLGNSLLREAGFLEFIDQFQHDFPTLGKHALVVFAHADSVHPTRVVVHERQRADLPDALIAALVFSSDVHLETPDLLAEVLGIHGVVARHKGSVPL